MYNPQETFDRIKEIRESRGITVSQLNVACDLSENTIASSAKSKNGLSAKALHDIAEVLGCSVDTLLGRTSSITYGNITGNNSGNAGNTNCSFGTASDCSEEAKEIDQMLKSLSFKDRAQLMNIIVDFVESHKT